VDPLDPSESLELLESLEPQELKVFLEMEELVLLS
jgi:hypothetical protein